MSQAQELVDGLLAQPWGQVTPSIYETGRVLSLAPWLDGQAQRISYLLDNQQPDGRWGPADVGYALVPTLSAVEALLVCGRRGDDRPEIAQAHTRGLAVLRGWLGDPPPLPDMPAIELIIASLIRAINGMLDEPLPVPPAVGAEILDLLLAAFQDGAEIPEKLLHALEILGPLARGHERVRPEVTGTVGASPAATAAWLSEQGPAPWDPSRRFLETAVRLGAGAVPCGLPITVFERGWVLSGLARAGLGFDPHPELILSLSRSLGTRGAPAAAGLPPDADTTAGALYALALLGSPMPPDLLWAYETETHFCTWPGEQGQSVSTNAHVLEAFGKYAQGHPSPAYTRTISKIVTWLCGQQCRDGSWTDRWHASPYYATGSAVRALADFGGEPAVPGLSRAAHWVLDAQRPDGSWGIWDGTAEETAYALQILALTSDLVDRDPAPAIKAGTAYLVAYSDEHPALWHDKDLYRPIAVVHASILAALHLGSTRQKEPPTLAAIL